MNGGAITEKTWVPLGLAISAAVSLLGGMAWATTVWNRQEELIKKVDHYESIIDDLQGIKTSMAVIESDVRFLRKEIERGKR